MSEEDKKESIGTIKSIRDIIFFIGIYLVLSGYVYSYYYFDYFGISIKQADVDYTQFIIHSYSVFDYYYKSIPFWVITISSLIFLYYISNKYVKLSKKDKLLIILLILCVFIPVVFIISKNAGVGRATSERDGYSLRLIQFAFTKEFLEQDSVAFANKEITAKERSEVNGGAELDRLIKQNDSFHLNLIYANDDRYFVVYYNYYNKHAMPEVYNIKKEYVCLAEILPMSAPKY